MPKGDYIMWWQTTPEEQFSQSETFQAIGRAYRALEGIETYIFAALMRSLDYADEETARVQLPDELVTIPVEGPEGQVFVLSASGEKGIRFHFSITSTPPWYRDGFWQVLAAYAEEWKQGALEHNLPLDPRGEESPTQWWKLMEATIEHLEETGEPSQLVGTIKID